MSLLLIICHDFLSFLFDDVRANRDAAGNQVFPIADRVPFFRHVEGDANLIVLHRGGGHERLGQHRDRRVSRVFHQRRDFGRFTFEFNRDVLVRVNTVFRQDRPQDDFGRRAFPRRKNRFAFQVGNRLDAVARFNNVQDAERVDRCQPDFAFGFVIQNRCQVAGNRGRVERLSREFGKVSITGQPNFSSSFAISILVPSFSCRQPAKPAGSDIRGRPGKFPVETLQNDIVRKDARKDSARQSADNSPFDR